jgi:transcriptional regulator with XRE-family HTH domain
MSKRFETAKSRQMQPTYFKAWRKFRTLTQQQVADRIGTTKTRVSLKERGLEPYDQYYLEALADALNTDTASLLARDPYAEAGAYAVLDALKPETRAKAIEIIRALKIADDHGPVEAPPIDAPMPRSARHK